MTGSSTRSPVPPDRRPPAGGRRLVLIASASGNGKTTLGRVLAAGIGAPFLELDELVHGPGWTETPMTRCALMWCRFSPTSHG